jgi:replicative DNA helicase
MADTYYESEEDNDEKNNSNEEEEVQKSVVEAQIINHVLDTGVYDFIRLNKLDETYFPGYEDEFKFIQNHYMKFQVVPDVPTFLDKFPDFDLFESHEAEAAMLESIKEAKGYSMVTPALNEINEAARSNSIEAAKIMRDKAEEILKEVNIVRFGGGYDIFKMAHERAEEYMRKIGLNGVVGCLMGIPKLDEVTHGILDEDFVGLTARPGQGKSWIQEFIILNTWLLQKRPILHFSLENSKNMVGYRADTLLRHFSNDALMAGKTALAWENNRPSMNQEDYFQYIEEAKHFDVPFVVYDNDDSPDGGWAIEDILEVAEAMTPSPAIISIDQLSLMIVRKRVKSIREGYIHTTRTSRQYVTKSKKPIILNCQSGRETAKMQMKDKEATPELHQIAESDSVGQDSTKILSLLHTDGLLKISLKKNTFGRSEVDAMLKWNIDRGFLEPLALEMGDPEPERMF